MYQILQMMDENSVAGEMETEAVPTPPIQELLDRRDRLNGWLGRLDSESDANPRVAERIRGDYTAQLEAIMGELAGHYDALCGQRAELDAEIESVRVHRDQARDALEEAELRHRIGEFDAESWEIRRGELQPGVDSADAELEALVRQADELDQVIAELREGLSPGGSGMEPLPSLEDPEAVEANEHAEPVGAGDALYVIDESEPVGEPSQSSSPADETGGTHEEAGATRPSPGVKCAECGYTNDYGALFCGVCGVDLA